MYINNSITNNWIKIIHGISLNHANLIYHHIIAIDKRNSIVSMIPFQLQSIPTTTQQFPLFTCINITVLSVAAKSVSVADLVWASLSSSSHLQVVMKPCAIHHHHLKPPSATEYSNRIDFVYQFRRIERWCMDMVNNQDNSLDVMYCVYVEFF